MALLARLLVQKKSKTPYVEPHFSILQFNALAGCLCYPDCFPHVDPDALTWEFRKQRLLDVITEHHYDFICMEEVDHYEDHFLPFLEKCGYGGVYKRKGWSKSKDGTAIFYYKKTVRLRDENCHILRYAKDTSQVAIILETDLLSASGEKEKSLFVAATHLKARLGFDYMRLTQGNGLLKEIEKLNTKNNPVVICGDFNDVPGSPVYDLFIKVGFVLSFCPFVLWFEIVLSSFLGLYFLKKIF